jgi:transcription antitermination factor NusG
MFKDVQGKEYKRTVTVPLFSRYVFARCDLASLWIHITSSITNRAIIGPLKTAGEFDTVPDYVIEEIREREGEDGLIKMYPDLEVGVGVRIIDGDYKDMTGIYDRRLSGEQRISILLDTPNGIKFHVPLDRSQVVPLSLH